MAALGFELVLRFLWGSLLVLLLVSRREPSRRFLRAASLFLVALTCLEAVLLSLAVRSAKIPTGVGLELRFPETYLGSAGLSLGCLAAGGLLYCQSSIRSLRHLGSVLFLLSPAWLLSSQRLPYSFNFLTASLLLGAVFAGQYIEHWSDWVAERRLLAFKHAISLLYVSVGLKSIEFFWALYLWNSQLQNPVDVMGRTTSLPIDSSVNLGQFNFSQTDFGVRGAAWLGFGTFGLVLLLARLLWGLLAPVVLSYLFTKTTDLRSPVSVTGLAYALCVAAVFGEATALYLNYTLGIFL